MLLRQVNIIGTDAVSDLLIRGNKIQAVYSAPEAAISEDNLSLLFDGAIAFPGLINSHDHLDFNLFPALGKGAYSNYTEWASDIHSADKAAIERVLNIPQPLRAAWGIYKNLINGVTTVINHGKYLAVRDDLITVFQRYRCLHSPAFERNWKWKINFSFSRSHPFVMHLGEGTDKKAFLEIDQLIRWNLFRKKVIAVHGVVMNRRQAASFRALVWCPASNYFLLNKTAAINTLDGGFPIMLGTDSTLTASWNFWEHLRLARKEKMVPDDILWHMLGSIPAKIWNLGHAACLAAGGQADLVIAAGEKRTPGLERFYNLNPRDLLLVLHQGHIRLFDARLLTALVEGNMDVSGFSKILVQGELKYVEGDLPGLMSEIRKYDPEVGFPVSVPG